MAVTALEKSANIIASAEKVAKQQGRPPLPKAPPTQQGRPPLPRAPPARRPSRLIRKAARHGAAPVPMWHGAATTVETAQVLHGFVPQ